MKKQRCPAPKLLVEFFDRKLSGKKIEKITEHVKNCQQCLRNLKIMNKIESILSMPDYEKPQGNDDEDARGHIGLDLLYDYLTGNVTEAEKISVQGHLNSCSHCYQEMTSLVHDSQPVPNYQETELLKAMSIPAPEGLVTRLLALSQATARTRPVKAARINSIRDRLADLREIFFNWAYWEPRLYLRAAFALTAVLVLFIIGATQFAYLQSTILANRGMANLTENYFIDSRSVPRPSGGFEYSELTRTRGPIDHPELPQVRSTLQKSLYRKNARASQYLATYYLVIEHNLDQASQYYHQALARDSANAKILNDLGSLAWHEQNLSLALDNFQRALAIEPDFYEARYNLALVLEQLGHFQKARVAWQNYLLLDHDSDWARIAQDHLNRLKQVSEF